MRIDELQTISSHNKELYKQIFNTKWHLIEAIRLLVMYDFEKAGVGMYSDVYFHPEFNFVIKATYTNNATYYDKFIMKYAKNNRHNSFMPIIYKKVHFKDGYFYILEKLYPLDEDIYIKFNKLNFLIDDIKYNRMDLMKQSDKQLIKDYPELFMSIIDMLKAGVHVDDLHNDNIMQRKDGSLVIIDPVAG